MVSVFLGTRSYLLRPQVQVAGRTARLWAVLQQEKRGAACLQRNEAAFQLVFFYVRQLHTAAPCNGGAH